MERPGFIVLPVNRRVDMKVNQTEILRSIRREQRNSEWIDKSLPTLRKKFGNRYIAVKNRKVIDSDEDFKRLLSRIRELGDPEWVTFEYVWCWPIRQTGVLVLEGAMIMIAQRLSKGARIDD
jgi:L-fucose isomerase-like protein